MFVVGGSIVVVVLTTDIFLSALLLLRLSAEKTSFFSAQSFPRCLGETGVNQSDDSLSLELFNDRGEESWEVTFDVLARKEVSSSILPSTLKNVESRKLSGAFDRIAEVDPSHELLVEGIRRLVMIEVLELPRQGKGR